MKKWLKFFGFHIPYFIFVGAIGGVIWLYVIKQYQTSQGDLTDEQVSHVVHVLKQSPAQFEEMIRLTKKNRQPLSVQEALLQEERVRMKKEIDGYRKREKHWLDMKEEELSRIREAKRELDDLRAEVDQKIEELLEEKILVTNLANRIVDKNYRGFIDAIVKLEPEKAARILADRPTREIVEDLRQFRSSRAAEIIAAMLLMFDAIKDPTEQEDFEVKLQEIISLFRAEGLKNKGE
jgi:hypothetical protein